MGKSDANTAVHCLGHRRRSISRRRRPASSSSFSLISILILSTYYFAIFIDLSRSDALDLCAKPFENVDRCFECFDQDQDGRLSSQEFGRLCQQLFSSSSIPPRDRNHEKTRQQPSASAATDDDLEREQGQVRYEPESILKSEKFRESLLTQTTTTAEGSSLSSPSVSRLEFLNHVWPQFIRPIVFDLEVSSALLVIDVQNDFISGSLATKDSPAGQDGREVIEPINELLPLFPAVNVVYSLDWHPRNHVSFFSNLDSRDWSSSTSSSGKEEEEEISEWDTVTFSGPPPFNQTLFPDHCVQETLGAQLHSDLKIVDGAYFVRKGTNPDLDSFSAFFDNIKSSDGSTGLDQHLLDVRNISTVFICGLATDYCVGSSALDSLSLGLNTFVILDASRGIADESIENMLNAIVDKGGIILNTADVEPLMMRARAAAAAAAAVLASAATAGSSSTGGNVISSSAFFFLILQRLLLLLLLRPTS